MAFKTAVIGCGRTANELHGPVLERHPEIDRENVDDILKEEVGMVFVHVLEDAGVFKCTPEGRSAFDRFISIL